MADLIVKLYELPPIAAVANSTYTIRRAFSAERRLIVRWVAAEFGDGWASECEGSFARSPVACYVAIQNMENLVNLVGFSCYDATARGVYGPVGVARANRQQGMGRALLLATLHDMGAQGYAYAAIGGAGRGADRFLSAHRRRDRGAGLHAGVLPRHAAGAVEPTPSAAEIDTRKRLPQISTVSGDG
jgi:hypothetical protein